MDATQDRNPACDRYSSPTISFKVHAAWTWMPLRFIYRTLSRKVSLEFPPALKPPSPMASPSACTCFHSLMILRTEGLFWVNTRLPARKGGNTHRCQTMMQRNE